MSEEQMEAADHLIVDLHRAIDAFADAAVRRPEWDAYFDKHWTDLLGAEHKLRRSLTKIGKRFEERVLANT